MLNTIANGKGEALPIGKYRVSDIAFSIDGTHETGNTGKHKMRIYLLHIKHAS